jgi:hypothetical protein
MTNVLNMRFEIDPTTAKGSQSLRRYFFFSKIETGFATVFAQYRAHCVRWLLLGPQLEGFSLVSKVKAQDDSSLLKRRK